MAYKQPSSGPFKMMGSSPAKQEECYIDDNGEKKCPWPTREERKKVALANSTKDMCWACGYRGCGICGKEKESTLGDFCTINEPLKRMCRKEP